MAVTRAIYGQFRFTEAENKEAHIAHTTWLIAE